MLKRNQTEGQLTGIKVSGRLHILHLLFVDDVLILTSADPAEWALIHSILNSFSTATGLEINRQKSIFLFSNIQASSSSAITAQFGIKAQDLDKGFTYLGFLLKSSRYSCKDWHWLIDKFNNKIQQSCSYKISFGKPPGILDGACTHPGLDPEDTLTTDILLSLVWQ